MPITEQQRLDRIAELEVTVKRFDEAVHALSFNRSHSFGDQTIDRTDLPDLMVERSKAVRELKSLRYMASSANFPDGARSPLVAYNRFRRG